jgi:hypothetical protein
MNLRKINKILMFFIMCFVIIANDDLNAQSVGIGDAADFTPDNSALLELKSIARGFLMPRMTAAQRIAISTPSPSTTPHGLMVIQTDLPNPGLWYYYNDGVTYEWRNIINTNPAVSFGDITTGTNISATMNVGASASIVPSGGIVRSNEFVNIASVSAAVDLNTSEVAGILSVDKGGTGTNVVPPAGGVIFSDGTTYSSTAAGTAGQILVSDGANPPFWQNPPAEGVTSVGLAMPTEFNVTNSPVTDNGTLTATWVSQNANLVLASPDLSSGTPAFRKIESADITSINASTITSGILGVNYGGTGLNSIPSAGSFLYSNGTGYVATAAPTSNGQILQYNDATDIWELVTPSSGGTVTSVGLDLPASVFSISGSPVTTSGTLTGTLIVQDKQKVFAGPITDPSAQPTFRLLEATDIPSLSTDKLTSGILPIARGGTNSGTVLNNDRIIVSSGGSIVEAVALTNGQLLIGSTGAAPVAGNVTAASGSGVSVTNGAGTIALALTTNQSGSAWNTLGNSATTAGTNFIGTTDAIDLSIKTNNTEQMRITSAGNVGIGVSPTTAKLQITDATNTDGFSGIQINQSGAVSGTGYGIFATKTGTSTTNVGGYFSASGGTNNYGLLVPSGNVGIGTSTPSQKFELRDGNILVTNSGTAGELRLQETNAQGTNFTGFKADTLTNNLVYIMPKDTVNELAVLVNYGTNKLKWMKTGDLQSQTRSNILEVINLASYSIPDTVTHVLVERSGVAKVTLYSGSQYSGKVIFIKRLSAGNGDNVEICPGTGAQIDRLGSAKGFILRNPNDALMMVYDGTNWWIMTAYLANNSIQLCNCP